MEPANDYQLILSNFISLVFQCAHAYMRTYGITTLYHYKNMYLSICASECIWSKFGELCTSSVRKPILIGCYTVWHEIFMAIKCYGLSLDEKLMNFNFTEAQLHARRYGSIQ